MSTDAPAVAESFQECFRCGYNLRGIPNDKPCPECGLLAERSRPVTHELHDTRPRWLHRLSRGIWLMLLAIFIALAWPLLPRAFEQVIVDSVARFSWPVRATVYNALPFIGAFVAGFMLFVAIFLLTTPEGYAAADQADRRRRRWLRLYAAVPILTVLTIYADHDSRLRYAFRNWFWIAQFLLTAGLAPIPLLVFRQLRSLARRIHSDRLAEYCAIVGAGTSLALLYVGFLVIIEELSRRDYFGTYWMSRSRIATGLFFLLLIAAVLFVLWALYILIRFAIAFRRAARQLDAKWANADLAHHTSSTSP